MIPRHGLVLPRPSRRGFLTGGLALGASMTLPGCAYIRDDAAVDAPLPPSAKAEIWQRLADLAVKLRATPGSDPSERAHRLTLAALLTDKEELARILSQPKRRPEAPPGMPIGDDGS